MGVDLPYNFNNDTLTKARLQEVLDLLAAANGQIGAEDLLSNAGIPQSKLGSISGTIQVEFPMTIQARAAGWPASGSIVGAAFPITAEVWTVKGVKYTFEDPGHSVTPSFFIQYGSYTAAAAWDLTTSIVGSTVVDLDAGAGTLGTGSHTVSSYLGATSFSPSMVAIVSNSAADANWIDGVMNVTLLLERSVTL